MQTPNISFYSNPTIVAQRWARYRDSPADGDIFIDDDGKHKYYIIRDNKKIRFGAYGYQDYTLHKNQKIRKAYRARAMAIKGKWKEDKYSKNNLAIHLLW